MASIERTSTNPDTIAKPLGAYSHAVRIKAQELVYIAGQVAVDKEGKLVGKGDVGVQAAQVFENIGLILQSLGATFSNVVEITIFLVGRETVGPYRDARADIYEKIFPDGDYPATTLLVISGLVHQDYLVEIKAVAAI